MFSGEVYNLKTVENAVVSWLALTSFHWSLVRILLEPPGFFRRLCIIQRCIQSASLRPGTHLFSFWTHRLWHKGSNWTQKKIECTFMQITNARKNMRTTHFRRKLNIPISHNGEMIEFLKFQGSAASDNETFQLKFSFLRALQVNFKH